MNFFENMTLRTRKTRSQSKAEAVINVCNSNESTLNGTTNSLPTISDDENDEILELKNQIDKLNSDLLKAREVITQLSSENTVLKNTITSMSENKHENVSRLFRESETPNRNTKQSTPNRKSHSSKKKQNLANTTANKTMLNTSTQIAPNYISSQTTEHSLDKVPQEQRKKICILSTDKVNKILSVAEDTFPNYELCHYLTPYGGVNELISNINLKLTDFTMNDYCIILIGEEDFRRTDNYFELIINIRETLMPLHNTNIILCLPTFKFSYHSSMMLYNGRIEMFNNLLYLDVETHKYALLFDSNFDLKYDHTMFTKHTTGMINNNGIKNMFRNLQCIVHTNSLDIPLYADIVSNPDISNLSDINIMSPNVDNIVTPNIVNNSNFFRV